MTTITIHNIETGEVIIREKNEEEIAQAAKDKAEADAKKILAQEMAAARTALLNKLGITEEEARLLLS